MLGLICWEKTLAGLSRLAALLVLMPTLAIGQVYEWKDENGNVNFGDSPPEGADAKPVDLPKGPSEAQVEQAQQNLQETLDARAQQDKTQHQSAPVSPASRGSDEPLPEFACYTPVEEVLQGPTQAAYNPINPTDVTPDQAKGARAILSRAKGNWRGSAVELLCSGSAENTRSEQLFFDVRSNGSWRDGEGLLVLENQASGSRHRVNETRVSYIEVGEALYFFEAKGDGGQTMNRTVAQRGNKSEGIYLDDVSLAFMNKRRSFHVMRLDIRHLKVTGNRLEYTELFFHNNVLTGSRVWTLRR